MTKNFKSDIHVMFFFSVHLCEDDPRAKLFVGNLDWETKEGIYIFDSY